MEYHIEQLAKLCRLCCQKIKTSTRYQTAKKLTEYKETINQLFMYDISQDSPLLHPTVICDSCRRKVEYCKGKSVAEQKIAVFPLHEQRNCVICNHMQYKIKHIFSTKILSQPCKEEQPIDISMDFVCSVALASGFDVKKSSADGELFSLCKTESNNSICIEITIKVFLNFSWKVFVYNHEVTYKNQVFTGIPKLLDVKQCQKLFTLFTEIKICPGNNDFPELINQRFNDTKTEFTDKQGNLKAKIQTTTMVDVHDFNTIRTTDCELFVSKSTVRCDCCQKHRATLHVL